MTLSEFYHLDTRRLDDREGYEVAYGSRSEEFEHVAYLFAAYSDIHVYRNKQTGEYVYVEYSIGD